MEDVRQLGEIARALPRTNMPSGTAGATTVGPRETTVNRRLTDSRREFLRFFQRRLSQPEDAEDALQDFCLKAIRAAENLDDGEKIDAWLSRILRNTLIDHYRRRATRQRAEAAYGREVQGDVLEGDTGQDERPCCCVHDVLPLLRPDYAEVLTQADLKEEPREQIAVTLGLTANNVGVRLHRARRALKDKLEEDCLKCRDDGYLNCGCPSGER